VRLLALTVGARYDANHRIKQAHMIQGHTKGVKVMEHGQPAQHLAKLVAVAKLKPHPRNYRGHPQDQVDHIKASIAEHGCYRNIVTAGDWTVLAGHGVVEACSQLGVKKAPVVRLDIEADSPQALKLLTGDNAISGLAMDDDRALTDILKELSKEDDLLGTGFNDEQLAALLMVTRTAAEIADYDAAAEWVGMPDYDAGTEVFRLVVSFITQDDRERFVNEGSIEIDKRSEAVWSTRWPWTEREDLASLKFEAPDD